MVKEIYKYIQKHSVVYESTLMKEFGDDNAVQYDIKKSIQALANKGLIDCDFKNRELILSCPRTLH